MSKQWLKYTKKVQGHPSYHYVLVDEDIVNDKEGMDEQCLYWADSTPGGQRYGFEYDWELVEHPPFQWLERAKGRAEEEIIKAVERQKMLTEEIEKVIFNNREKQ